MPINALLDSARASDPATALPPFNAINAADIAPAIDALLADAQAAQQTVTADDFPADYAAISAVLGVAGERLGRAWGAVGHLQGVADTPELRAAYNELLPRVTDFYTQLSGDERLYAKYKAIAATNPPQNPAQQAALAHSLRDFVLAGAELQGAAKARYADIQNRSAELAQQFSEHVLDATDGFHLLATEAQMDGVPADVKDAARLAAEAAGQTGYRITLHAPSYFPVLQYATDRSLREQLYRAHVTRASEHGPAELDNTALMRELLALRQEEAQLLGHAHFSAVSLVPKMAQSSEQVQGFLRDLAAKARPFAEKDWQELQAFARDELGITDLQSWDVSFASEKLKQARYAVSDQVIKPYFTEPQVLAGLFGIIETLFGVQIKPDTAPVWHESVRFFRIERAAATGDAAPQLVGQFYLDLFARPGKRPGAWMDDVRGRWARPDQAGRVQTPVAHLVCNFAPPVGNKPALLTHDDVTTLFHEFGHGLHHLLTQVDELSVSGISGVEWDAVELPSQFMENFCWEWAVLSRLTRHVDTGEPLPRELFDKMLAAKNFQSGLQLLRQVEFALFDMRAHAEPGQESDLQALINAVRDEVAVIKPPAFNRFQNSFSHIFAGGYSAGYYSYLWAEVLSADAWSAFQEAGVFDKATGQRWHDEVLSRGGSRSAAENFRTFRGREPQVEALLAQMGMV